MFLCSSVVIFLVSQQQTAAKASVNKPGFFRENPDILLSSSQETRFLRILVTPDEEISNQATLQSKLTELLPLQQLPPLGEPSQYLPQPELIPESPIQKTRLVLKLSERRVYFYQDNQVQVSYPVAIGRNGWETPTGSFEVIQMVSYPTWQHPFTGELIPPGADNPLGVRWIGFATKGENYIGFHGTPNEELIGQAVSHGCVRMRNDDVVSLFEQVEMGTPVMVEP